MTQDLIFSVENRLGLITLNRPQALNALTHEMILALSSQLNDWALNDNISAVIIRACEGRAFCAGGDVRSLYDLGRESLEAPLQFFKDEYQLNHLIAHYPKPYLAFVHGFTFGGGVGISLHSPYTIASEDFVFAMPETSIGFFPDIGASHMLTRCGTYGIYLGLTGARLHAKEALALKLIRAIIPHTAFDDLIHTFSTLDLSQNAAQQIDDYIKKHTIISETKLEHADEIETCFNASSIEQIELKLQSKNTPWANEVLAQLKQKSPVSLAVTLEQLTRAKTCTLDECLMMDYTLAYHFMQHHDFFEGVRALLVDKDKQPRWSDLHDTEHVLAYFNSPEHAK